MKLLAAKAEDGLSVPMLYSEPAGECYAAVLHVHGWGGNFCENAFVQRSHEYFPARGIAFASLNLRTSGYLQEKYTEDDVRYVGASITDPIEALADIDAAIRVMGAPWSQLVLQGHSFGTNVVRVYASMHPELQRAMYLSPADSVALYERWRALSSYRDLDEARTGQSGARDPIEWTQFGMAAGDAAYPVPITRSLVNRVVEGAVFQAWSAGGPSVSQRSLVVVGSGDPIAAVGNTATDDFFRRELARVKVARVSEARHLFAGHEQVLLDIQYEWLAR